MADAGSFVQELPEGRWAIVLPDRLMSGFIAPEALRLYQQSGQETPSDRGIGPRA